ncbi:hypothetical protein ACQKPX_23765 [Photobacterium sp. DNB23_23_1]
MRLLVGCIAAAMSLSAFAMTDQEVCEAYGVALASNSDKGRVEFMSEMESRVENKTWSLSAAQCNDIAMESKYEFDLDLALDMSH